MADGSSGGSPVLKVLGIVALIGLLCCGGGAAVTWYGTAGLRESFSEFANLPEEERAARIEQVASDLARSVVGDKDAVVFTLFAEIEAGRDDAAYALYAPSLQSVQSREEFTVQADTVRTTYGAYRSNLLRHANQKSVIGKPGTFDLRYRLTFDHGKADLHAVLEDVGGTWRIQSWTLGPLEPGDREEHVHDGTTEGQPEEDFPEPIDPGDEPK